MFEDIFLDLLVNFDNGIQSKIYIKKLSRNETKKLTNDDLKDPKFSKLESIDISGNIKITQLNHLTSLKIIICHVKSLEKDFKECINLEELHCQFTKIRNLNIFKKLKILNCSHCVNIIDYSFYKCILLEDLNCQNTEIHKLKYYKSLKILYCNYCININDESIKLLTDLEELYCWNTKISNLNHCSKLKIIGCYQSKCINESSISRCLNLKEIHCENIRRIQ